MFEYARVLAAEQNHEHWDGEDGINFKKGFRFGLEESEGMIPEPGGTFLHGWEGILHGL